MRVQLEHLEWMGPVEDGECKMQRTPVMIANTAWFVKNCNGIVGGKLMTVLMPGGDRWAFALSDSAITDLLRSLQEN